MAQVVPHRRPCIRSHSPTALRTFQVHHRCAVPKADPWVRHPGPVKPRRRPWDRYLRSLRSMDWRENFQKRRILHGFTDYYKGISSSNSRMVSAEIEDEDEVELSKSSQHPNDIFPIEWRPKSRLVLAMSGNSSYPSYPCQSPTALPQSEVARAAARKVRQRGFVFQGRSRHHQMPNLPQFIQEIQTLLRGSDRTTHPQFAILKANHQHADVGRDLGRTM